MLGSLFLFSGGRVAEAQYCKTTVATWSTTNAAFTAVPRSLLQFTPAAASEVWILLVSARLQTSATVVPSVEAQYLVNGIVHGMGGIQSDHNNGPDGSWEHFYRVTGTTAQQTVEVQLRAASGTSTINELQLIAFKLPANADFQYIENDTLRTVTANSYNNYQTLTFTPSSAGTYVIMAVANAHRPSGSTVAIRLDNSGFIWPVDSGVAPNYMANPNNAWQSFFLVRAPALSATPQTYNISANGGTGSSEIQYTRIMAFRTDVFASYEFGGNLLTEVDVTNTTMQQTANLNTAAPPSSRDYIVIQSFVMRASAASGTGNPNRVRKAQFLTMMTAKTTYTQAVNDANYWATYGYFDAVTTSQGLSYQNYAWVSNASVSAFVKESVIHVLGLPKTATPLQVTPGAGVPTPAACAPDGRSGRFFRVTAPASFEMIFDTAIGGGVECLFDLAEDPAKEYDLAGDYAAGAGFKALTKLSFLSSGTWYHPDDNHNDTSLGTWSGSPPRLDLLEATPTRVRLREEAFFQALNGSAIFNGAKAFFDYTVYPTGKMAVRQNRKTTKATATVSDRGIESSTTGGHAVPDPRYSITNYTGCAQNAGCNTRPGPGAFTVQVAPGLDDFILHKHELVTWITPPPSPTPKSGGARMDLLDILYQDWVTTATPPYQDDVNQVEYSFADDISFMNWRDNTAASALPAPASTGSDEVWNHLFYFKPTNLGSTANPALDGAVVGRSDDFRGPSGLSFTGGYGTHWGAAAADPAENVANATDDFNESEAAYVLNADPTQPSWAKFSIDGISNPRYAPVFKLRQWRSVNPPATVKLDTDPPTASVTLAPNVDYRADVKPVARAPFVSNLLWHSTLESPGAVTGPDVGSAGTANGGAAPAAGRYGQGYLFDAPSTKSVSFASASNLDPTRGEVEFWYQPRYASASDGVSRVLWHNDGDATHYFRLEKTVANALVFTIRNGASTASVTIPSPTYTWRDQDWVHLRATWDAGAAAGQQAHLFFDGMELASVVGTYSAAGMTAVTNYIGNDSTGSNPANGVIDEFSVYGGNGPTPLAEGGLVGSSNEYLNDATVSKNFALTLAPLDGSATRRGAYFYLGAESKFRGLNFVLATAGSGPASTALDWQYWDGTQWASLRTGGTPLFGFTDGTNSLTTARGSVYWASDPTNWSTYSVDGGPDLYFVRLRLPNGAATYSTAPVEARIATDILLLQYHGDLNNLNSLDIGPAVVATAVRLAAFGAVGLDSAVSIEWETGTELDNLGFNLYRSLSGTGPWERLNESLIPGLGSSMEGKSYGYVDSGLSNGVDYFYQLEDVDRSGRVTSHGPVWATPRAGTDGPPPEPPPSPGPEPPPGGGGSVAAWISHGNPGDVSLRVVARTERSVTFELRTGGFYSLAQDDGSSRLFIPGFWDLAEPGFPALPTRRAWTDAVVGLEAHIASLEAEDLVSFEGLLPPRAGAPQALAAADGTYRASFRRVRAAVLARGLYPRAQARVLQTAFRGDVKSAYLEFAPLRVDVSGSRLVLARRMLVTVVFDGIVPGETGTGSTGSRGGTISRSTPRLIARFATRDKGLHAVRWDDLLAAATAHGQALRSFNTSLLRLSRRGVVVPFHVEPRREIFGPGSTLFFLSEGAEAAYGTEAVYELARARDGAQMALRTLPAPSGAPPDSLVSSRTFETNADYLPGLLEARDRWLWSGLLGGTGADFSFTLASLAPGPARLRVDLQGASDTEAPVDHHVRVSIGGVPLALAEWDGMTPFTLEADVVPGVLVEGINTLRLDSDGAATDAVYLDRISVDYPHALAAEAGILQGRAVTDGPVEASGFSAGSILLDLSSRPTWLGVSEATSGLVFAAETGHDYLAVDPASILRPEIRPAPLDDFSLRVTSRRADWIVIAPRKLLSAAEPLRLHREAQGLVAVAVSLEQVYDSFGSGEASPDAIRDFLAYAYHHWSPPAPRYVLLLGDASYDPKGFFPSASRKDLLPSPSIKSSFLWTVSDPLYAAVNGDDLLPDLAIGRLTAGSVEEAEAAVEKILDFENAHLSLDGKAVLVADDSDPLAGDFEADANDIATLLAPRPVQKVFLSSFPSSTDAQAAVLSAFDAGSSLFSYVGHGSQGLWASEGLLRAPDVDRLAPQPRQPFVLTMTCSNGYFVSPWANSIAERLTLAPGRGAIAAFSPSGLSLDSAAHLYHRALVHELETGRHVRIGDLVLAAQGSYLDTGALPELVSLYHLFSDPALVIR